MTPQLKIQYSPLQFDTRESKSMQVFRFIVSGFLYAFVYAVIALLLGIYHLSLAFH